MFHIAILIIVGFYEVVAVDHNNVIESIVYNLSTSEFLDDNGYIRLNITWGDSLDDAHYISIYFNNDQECNPISDVENFPLDNHYIIEPSMELEHPADYLKHGCIYNITLRNKEDNRSQNLMYKVPDCVDKKCQCKNSTESPNKLTSIELISEDKFMVSWNKSTNGNVTVHYIYYHKKDAENNVRTIIPEEDWHYVNNAVEVPIHDIKMGVSYTVTVVFIDEYNECIYFSSLDYTGQSSKNFPTLVLLFCGTSLVFFVLLVYVVLLFSPKIRRKLKKYVTFFSKSYEENLDSLTPLSQIKYREEINAQYTPLEFVLKMHKYDWYEFPRNKIIIKDTIGEGAFGKVYYAKAYDINDKPGFTIVAVKQLKERASEEESIDFLSEIDTLKKIGSHENIVKLLGCVTMEKPYMMIMELVPGGSLKKYLLQIRKMWSEKKNLRNFFPDDMDEHWLKNNNQKYNYSSYILPDVHLSKTPTRTNLTLNKSTETDMESFNLNNNGFVKTPCTPSSINSSGLPSIAETESTNLDSELNTPFVDQVIHQPEPVLDHTELQQFAFQIANGMAWLEKIPITHRDLAARNILITSDKVLKISDYGMSRPGPYVNQKSKKVPLRWMAIESIEKQKWNSKSDVWSFGIVLWEIGTLGGFPYEEISDVLILPELKKGKRLERPRICTDELYALMLKCWSENSDERPSFSELVELLDVKKQKVYVDFDQLSPKYVFPPVEHVTADGGKT